MRTSAVFFDGQTAGSRQGSLELHGGVIRLRLDDEVLNYDGTNARIIPPVGKGTWVLESTGGARVQFDNEVFGQAAIVGFDQHDLVGHIERSWYWAVAALIVAVFGTWLTLTYGIPAMARHVAFSISADLDRRISSEGIEVLDRLVFEPSLTQDSAKNRIEILFEDIRHSNSVFAEYRLEFRASPKIGANAFAVPGGVVILTDEMIEVIKTDDEIVAVLSHEIGHLAQRHSLRLVLQNSASAVIIAALTGDISNVTALSATIPTVLMQSKYSRDFEREADEFAFQYLESRELNTDALSELLLRIESQAGDNDDRALTAWFSTHPPSELRQPESQ